MEKEGGKKRPIGISALENKIVQKAVAKILDVVYDSARLVVRLRTDSQSSRQPQGIAEPAYAPSFDAT